MKLVFKGSLYDAERSVWIAAVLILATGYYGITQLYERQITASLNRSETLHEQIAVNRGRLAESGQVELLREQLRANLSGISIRSQGADSMATFLRDLNSIAEKDNAQVFAISPQREGATPPNVRAGVTASSNVVPNSSSLRDEVLDISVRGHFSDLLEFVAQLPHQHILLEVRDVRFDLSTAKHRDALKPLLDARIHTLIWHLPSPELLGEI